MIEQYTISTTPKYNFPQPNRNVTVPPRFIELSINSLRQVQNNFFASNQQTVQEDVFDETISCKFQLKRQALPLFPKHQEITVSAIDTSTIKIGETKTGIVIAIRGVTVTKQKHNCHYNRIGPFIFHITEENKNAVYHNLEKDCFNVQHRERKQTGPTLLQMPTRLANLLERWLQTNLVAKNFQGLVLFDGSLTGGTSETPAQRMEEILSIARKNHNIVLSFSKATSLRSNGYLITDLLPDTNPPYLLETTGLRLKPPMVLFGDVYVARLSKSNMAFRLDIDKKIPFQNQMLAVERLIGNDTFEQSYPETLRIAHILCTFTATEVLAMKRFVAGKHGVQIINRPDMHRLLFGPFGREVYA